MIKTKASELRPRGVAGGDWSFVADLTPRIMGRRKPLYGRMGLNAMTKDVMKASEVDTAHRAHGLKDLKLRHADIPSVLLSYQQVVLDKKQPCLIWVMSTDGWWVRCTAASPLTAERHVDKSQRGFVPEEDIRNTSDRRFSSQQ